MHKVCKTLNGPHDLPFAQKLDLGWVIVDNVCLGNVHKPMGNGGIFGVYHPKKPGQNQVVFNSSAQYNGVSLNDVLLTGPDLNNPLLGVLLRFCKESVDITADIQQMFYCFLVKEEDRNFLRFLWF